MKRFFILLFIFSSCSLTAPLKKSRIISLYHLIELGKYDDAKVVADAMVEGEESSQWANAWYARGYLCQTAYREGRTKNDPKLYELYPDQLYVTWESYEKARELDAGQKMEKQLEPKYILLANDFQDLGIREFKNKNYDASLRAFEHALQIENLPFLLLQPDTLLIYNTALAAFESNNWDHANKYFGTLHKLKFSENATHLLFRTKLHLNDSIAAQRVLFEGLEKYDDHENLVFLLSEFLYNDLKPDEALTVIDDAIAEDSDNPNYYYNKGLIYQKTNQFQDAINAYTEVLKIDPDNMEVFVNIATCYYNIGVAYEERTLLLTNNKEVKKERVKSKRAFQSALHWLDAAIENQPKDEELIGKLSQLYDAMDETDKTKLLMLDNE
jgi:tetratricopeptide (TPR) repeat protein